MRSARKSERVCILFASGTSEHVYARGISGKMGASFIFDRGIRLDLFRRKLEERMKRGKIMAAASYVFKYLSSPADNSWIRIVTVCCVWFEYLQLIKIWRKTATGKDKKKSFPRCKSRSFLDIFI